MRLAEVLVKPIVTEKSNKLSDSSRTYAFRVARKSNKLEIKKAIEEAELTAGVEIDSWR